MEDIKIKEQNGDEIVIESDKVTKETKTYSIKELQERKEVLISRIYSNTKELEEINNILKLING